MLSLKRTMYSDEEMSVMDASLIPYHVAIIMDGNRRWSKQNNKSIERGHWRGGKTLDSIVRASIALGIKVLTVYAFSTENWGRSQTEIGSLMKIFKSYLIRKRSLLMKEGVRLATIGDCYKLPQDVQEHLHKTKEMTKEGSRLDLVLALNYGGRDEIRRSVLKVGQALLSGTLKQDEISEETIRSCLDTAQWPDPDLVIRTGGVMRKSNFLIWQTVYSEFIISDILWPDFSQSDLFQAVVEFQKRQRRFGL